MANTFDNLPFNDFRQNSPAQTQSGVPDFQNLLQQASQNPKAFEEHLRQTNPQAYQRAMQVRNSANPRAMIVEMAKARGVNPNILKMFGL